MCNPLLVQVVAGGAQAYSAYQGAKGERGQANFAAGVADTPEGRATAVAQNRTVVAKRQGVYGNIKTTPLGDASYGTSTVARFGKAA